MKLKPFLFLSVLFFACSVFIVSAQEGDDFNYVDIKKTNDHITFLETENENHTNTIAANNERKAFLENRIQESEARLVKIQENMDYTVQTNLDLNNLYRESKDRATKERLDQYRDDLISVVYLLKEERIQLEKTDKGRQGRGVFSYKGYFQKRASHRKK